ncbi:hypothetical protein BUALT_Bualt02G0083600 [Buddleja alternifolia]|uniref:Telomeric single stranded DNA binding POT1/Cdc13 domain-containing protein n=1 Tax=Buddleja alternifolia TaxID=168488 RepID=A0AAV6Y041_9LAMI|nr:hypothetical protein BUALT_Bualt02G0083600 [Buddleja alternifolia]
MRSDDYRFMQIVDAIACINQRVNLIGVVVDSSLPKSTKGTDYFCSVKIIDESRSSLGIYINFFAETMKMLPYVESVGDIIVVSQVVVKTRGSEVYALYNKKFSSFALFEGRDYSKEFAPYQNSLRFQAREHDKKFIMGLRKWLGHHKIEGLSQSLSLREIKEGEHFNLLCKILHICEDNCGDWMLFVWDGTDTPPASVEAKHFICRISHLYDFTSMYNLLEEEYVFSVTTLPVIDSIRIKGTKDKIEPEAARADNLASPLMLAERKA